MERYDGNSIRILEGLEAVRVRPGMYIGSTGSKGLHHLIWEILDNAIDEHLAGYCQLIKVTLHKNGSISVEDDGRGIPADKHPQKQISTIRVVFSILHAGGKFNNDAYTISGGLHGVGASVVNALSSELTVEVRRNGVVYRDHYKDGGKPQIELVDGMLPAVGETTETGTFVTFTPDATIFETTEFKADIIVNRLKELAFLNRDLQIVFTNEMTGEVTTFQEKEGIVGLVRSINETKDVAHDGVLYVTGKSGGIEVEVAIQYTKDYSESIVSFCNNVSTIEGGTHVSGLKSVLTRIVNQYARESGVLKEKDANFEGRDVRSGITAVLLIKHPQPQYEGQTKTKLGNSNARGAVEDVLANQLPLALDRQPQITKTIMDLAHRSYKVRKVEEKAKTGFLSKTSSLTVNSKLASCQIKDPKKREIIFVEGDSAGGSAKQGRDRKFQAILPLKGKILNVEKASMGAILKNQEVASIVTALGCGFGEGLGNDFDASKCGYDKIIILTDADVDGRHIRTLLLTFFYRFMPGLIHEGKVYIGIPPLYKVTTAKETFYLYSDQELEAYRSKAGSKKFELQRYKGLGEMNPEQLWETTLNPETRHLKQVEIEDAIVCDQVTTMLMGSKVPPRRAFIESQAQFAEIDV